MRLLLDTHALLWWLDDSTKLSKPALAAIGKEGNEVAVSAVSAFEVCLKHSLGKLPGVGHLAQAFDQVIAEQGFSELAVSVRHATIAGGLPIHHKDPFDRLLVAQALFDGLTIVSNERAFDRFGVQRLW